MTNPKCPTCSDYHFVCRESGKTPCPLKTDYIGNVPKGGHLHDYVPCPDCMRPSKDSYTGCICGYPTWQSVLPKFIEDHFPKGHADRGVAMTAVIMFMLENYG